MLEKKFGETPLVKKSLFEAIYDENKKGGFEYSGMEDLSETSETILENGIFTQGPVQTLPDIEARYKKPGVAEVKLVRDPRNPDSVWVFVKNK